MYRTYQSPPQRVQVSRHLSQQEVQLVADDVDLLFGLHAVVSGGLQEELRGDLLQRGDLPPPAEQLLLQSLQQGATDGWGSYTDRACSAQLHNDQKVCKDVCTFIFVPCLKGRIKCTSQSNFC